MKKALFLRICVSLAAFLCLTATVLSLADPAFALSREPHGWYCKRTTDHTQPPVPPELQFAERYGGYWLDRSANADAKVIYLTFDAGYENGNVEKVLDVLQAHKAPGAFFILDNLIRREPELVRRMAAEGHTVGNHTAHHRDMTKISDKAVFQEELQTLAELYRSCTQQEMAKYYRPPEGKFSEENLQFASELGYKTVFWSFAYADWDNSRQPAPEAALEKLKAHLHPGEVLLLHPTSATNAAILDRFLTYAASEGYRFGTLDQLCGA